MVEVVGRRPYLKDPDSDEEREEQFILLEQASAHVRVHVVREEIVEFL